MLNIARFNLYLCLAAAIAFTSGCASSGHDKKNKEKTLVELHLEVNADGQKDNESVPIYRENPIYVNVEKEPFLDGADVDSAVVLQELGGFVIRIKFNWRGTQILNTITSSNPGKRIAILAIFTQSRWLAAPQIRKQITDGTISFTPDATRAEADLIVKGLNNVATELKKKDTF